jgi:DNA invertase Pin-like site-specific DNA recombinase
LSTSTGSDKRAVIYDRVSEPDETSQAAHLRQCEAFCEARGWDVVDRQTDTASGFSRKVRRPGWDVVQRLVEDHEVDAVVVFAVSRAGRNLASFARFVELCRDHDVTFASATEPIESAGPFGRVFLALLSALAEMESETKRERAMLGEEAHRRNGTYRGGNLAFGFAVEDGKKLVVDDVEAKLIREGASAFLNGASLKSVAQAWNDAEEFPHPSSPGAEPNPWTGEHVRTTLRSERLVPEILTASDHRRLVRVFETRRTGRAPDRYLLSGLVRCAVHDRPMTGRAGKYACRHDPNKNVHLTVGAGNLNVLGYVLAERRDAGRRFEAATVHDPTDDLVQAREKLVAELYALGDSDLSEHVIRGREAKLVRQLEDVEAQIETATPRSATFYEQWVSRHGADSSEFIRRHVQRMQVGAVGRRTNRFDPGRVRVQWVDGEWAEAAEVKAAWEQAQATIRADALDAEQVDEDNRRAAASRALLDG